MSTPILQHKRAARAAYLRAYYAANRDRIHAQRRAYNLAHREERRDKRRAYHRAYYAANRDRIDAQRRARRAAKRAQQEG